MTSEEFILQKYCPPVRIKKVVECYYYLMNPKSLPQVGMPETQTYRLFRSEHNETRTLHARHISDNSLMHYLIHEMRLSTVLGSSLCPTAFAPIFRALIYGGKLVQAAPWTDLPPLCSLSLHFDVDTIRMNSSIDSVDKKALETRNILSKSIQGLLCATVFTLEKLHLAFTIKGGFRTEYPARCGDILPDNTIANLRSLVLEGVSDKSDFLTNFLKRQRMTLESVRLADIVLGGSVAELCKALSALNDNRTILYGTPKGVGKTVVISYGYEYIPAVYQEYVKWEELHAYPNFNRQ